MLIQSAALADLKKNLHGQCLMEYPRVPKSDHKKIKISYIGIEVTLFFLMENK